MDIMYERCCGLDVHKQTVVACVLLPERTAARQGDPHVWHDDG